MKPLIAALVLLSTIAEARIIQVDLIGQCVTVVYSPDSVIEEIERCYATHEEAWEAFMYYVPTIGGGE